MRILEGSDGVRLEVSGGPAYLRIKKATLRAVVGGPMFDIPGMPSLFGAASRGLHVLGGWRRSARRQKNRRARRHKP